MQWILQDIPLGRNIQTVRITTNGQHDVTKHISKHRSWKKKYQGKRFESITDIVWCRLQRIF